jgi:Myb-like DNA-binding protein FlbD
MDHRQPPPSHHAAYHLPPPAQPHYSAPSQPTQIPIQPAQRPEHRRGPWSQQEDSLLMDLVQGMDKVENWVKISEQIRTRSAKQCRERYHQNLKPSLSHQPISREEGEMILQLVNELGPKWAEIARRLHNRSDNAVKNWYNGSKNRARRHAQAAAKRAEHRAHHHHLSAHDLHHQQQLQYAQQQSQQSPQPHSGSAGYSHSSYEYSSHHHSPSYDGYHPHQHHQSSSTASSPSSEYYVAPTTQRHYPPPILTSPQSPQSMPRHGGLFETPLPSPNSSSGYHSNASSPPDYRHYVCTPRPQTSGSSSSTGTDSHHYQYSQYSYQSASAASHHETPRESSAASWYQTPKSEGSCVLPPIRPRSSVEVANAAYRMPTPSSPTSEEPLKPEAVKPTDNLQKEINNKMSVNNILC